MAGCGLRHADFAAKQWHAYIANGDREMTTKPKPSAKRLTDSNSTLLADVRSGKDTWARTAMKSPDSARAALQKMGLLTPTGRLTKHYK